MVRLVKLETHLIALSNLRTLPVDLGRLGLFGFSSGAFAALQFAVRYPERIAGLALESGGPYKCSYLVAQALLSRRRLPNLAETDSASSTEGQDLSPRRAADAAIASRRSRRAPYESQSG
jgi:pimeloyl-ACP methyl ester carboxylesterase